MEVVKQSLSWKSAADGRTYLCSHLELVFALVQAVLAFSAVSAPPSFLLLLPPSFHQRTSTNKLPPTNTQLRGRRRTWFSPGSRMYTMLHHGAAPGSPPQRRYDLRGGRSASNQPTANHPPPTTNDQPTTNHQPRTNLLSARPQQRPRSAPRSIRLGSSMRLCIFVRVRRRPSTAPRTARRCHDRPLEARGQTPRCDEPTG